MGGYSIVANNIERFSEGCWALVGLRATHMSTDDPPQRITNLDRRSATQLKKVLIWFTCETGM